MKNYLEKLPQKSNTKNIGYLILLGFLGLTLYLRFADLGGYVTPDEPYWMDRSNQFLENILKKEWGKTLFLKRVGNENRTVQGIITRWVAGTALLNKGISREFLKSGQLSIALTSFLLIGILSYFVGLLYQDKTYSIILFFILLLDPFLLSLSRVVHVDSLLSLLLLISLITYLLALKEKKIKYIVISGLTAGMAILQKAPALSVLPFAGVASLIYIATDRNSWRKFINLNAVWIIVTLSTIFLLYPAMWVKPKESVELYFSSTLSVVGSIEKDSRNLISKTIPLNNSVILFYIVVLLIKATLAELTGLVYFFHESRKKIKFTFQKDFYLLIIFIGIFTLQMSTGKTAVHRYILPAHITLLILASWGLTTLWNKKKTKIIVTLIMIMQLGILVQKHPYSFLYKNPFFSSNTYDLYDSTWGLGVERASKYTYEQAQTNSLIYIPYSSIPNYTFANEPKTVTFVDIRALPCAKKSHVPYIILSRGTATNHPLENFLKENKYHPEKTITIKDIPVAFIFKVDLPIQEHINSICNKD